MATATPYKNPEEAAAGLNASFGPANDAQKAAIAGAAALVPGASPAPVVSPIQRTMDPGAAAADKYLSTFRAPESSAQIAERLRQGSQSAIDAINKTYDDQVAAKGVIGQERLAQDNAISVLSGLTGSSEAGRTRGATLDKNDKEVQAVNNERLLKLQSLYTTISKDAEDQAQRQRESATTDANSIVANRKEAQAKAVENIKLMAAGGEVDYDSFKSSPDNAKVYQYALDSVGGSEQALRGLFAVNRPVDQLVGSPVRVGDHFIQAYQNPLTGKIAYDTVDVPGGLPTEYKNFQKIGDNLVAIPDGWDGDMRKLKTIYSAPAGGVGGVGSGSAGSAFNAQPTYASLTSPQKTLADAANNLVNSLQTYREHYEQMTDKSGGNFFGKDAATLAAERNALVSQYSVAVGSGAVQQADANLIAKILPDPTSVNGIVGAAVKGGRGGGLSAIDSQIAKFTNQLTGYGLTPINTKGAAPAAAASQVLVKDGQSFDASQLSPEEYQQAISDGYAPQ